MKSEMVVYIRGILLVFFISAQFAQTNGGPYIGCYYDESTRAMESTTEYKDQHSMTVELCEKHCRTSYSYTFFGLQFAYVCFCGDSYNRYGNASEAECSMPCVGNASQMCGAGFRNSVYAVCPEKHWGQNCEEPCHCDGSDVCIRSNGTCNSDCLAGWLGTSCNIPDCTNNNGECNHTCHQWNGRKWCSCFSGYDLDPDAKGCSDINECSNGTHQCSAGEAFCANSNGGYSCSCPEGLRLQADNTTCADIDECMENSHECSEGVHFCRNMNGSYSCSCPDGHSMESDNHTCTDIDECSDGHNHCSAGTAFCRNTKGSYVCLCPEGYELEPVSQTCADIDECTAGIHECSEGKHFCHNTNGSYTCSCPGGHRLQSDNHTCADIDECTDARHQCSEGSDFCHNVQGSYTCSCPAGYELEKDNHTCTGECEKRFELTIPRASNLESKCETLETLHNVTFSRSARRACKIGGNVIASVYGAFFIKTCRGGDIKPEVTKPGAGWDIYQKKTNAEPITTTEWEIYQETTPNTPANTKQIADWVIATAVIVPCVILAASAIVVIYLVRRHNGRRNKRPNTNEQSPPQHAQNIYLTPKELTNTNFPNDRSTEPCDIYEEIADDPKQLYLNEMPEEKTNANMYHSLNGDEIAKDVALATEYELMQN